MRKSFVFKDQRGRPGGYLIRTDNAVLCRADTGEKNAQAVILFEEGGPLCFALVDGGGEEMQPCENHTVSGGYVHAGGELLLATDEAARLAFEKEQYGRRSRRAAAENGRTENVEEEKASARRDEHRGNAMEAHRLPERRWPPPPCWPEARYMQGGWQDTDQVSG